jgi:two-component system, chemotaxis family, protein-glutamate methylesterase/glutaminase
MERPIRVLVVDDSVVARRFVSARLEADPEIEVVGTASNGRLALQRIDRDPPDVVILDDEMPEMRGRDILKVLRARHPTVAVVMFSGTFHSGPLGTFDALSLGADDGVAKPGAGAGRIEHDHPVWAELLDKAKKAFHRPDRGGTNIAVAAAETPRAARDNPASRRGTQASPPPPTRASPPRPARTSPPPTSHDAVAIIASSTGGPEALGTVFAGLPATFPLPIVVVQHMPPTFTRLLAERLDRSSALLVREATDDAVLEPGHAWIAPGDHHVRIHRDLLRARLRLDQGPPENSCRPAADPLFRSAVDAYGGHVLALVLSGMGQDGLAGCTHVADVRGHIIVQDEATSVVWGMPGYVARAGLADQVLPLPSIADAFTDRAHRLDLAARSRRVAT